MKEKRTWLYNIAKAIGPAILGLPFGVKAVKGKNSIPESGRFVVCSNHISMLDPVFISLCQKRQIHYMAKQELFDIPVLKHVFAALGAFPIKRGKADANSINTATEILQKGRLLGIFPEGTRSKDGELLKPKAGAVMVAHSENAPIIPVAIYTKGGKVRLFKRVYVAFGEPVTTQELGMTTGNSKELREAARNQFEIIEKLRQECIDYAEGRGKK